MRESLAVRRMKWAMYCGEKDPDPNETGCTAMKSARDSDCLFNWGEDNYPALLTPARPASQMLRAVLLPLLLRQQQLHRRLAVRQPPHYLGGSGTMSDLGLAATWSLRARCR